MFIRLFLPEKGNIIAVILVLINGQTQENNFAGKMFVTICFRRCLIMEKELQKIGHRIKLLRIENKISQKVLAKKLCISQTHLSNIENGRVGVTLLHLIKIKELFECPIEYFFEEKTLSENEAEKNECQKIKTIVEENNFRLEDLSKAIEIMKVLQKGGR